MDSFPRPIQYTLALLLLALAIAGYRDTSGGEEMKYWYDTEFIEDGKTIDLISIGIVAEDGREFYAQNGECRLQLASQWVEDNVFPSLDDLRLTEFGWARRANSLCWEKRHAIREKLLAFIGSDIPEFWGYYSAYDHIALCQLFGTMMDLPEGWPMFTRDIQQEADRIGFKAFPEQQGTAHNALDDARWTRDAWRAIEAVKARTHGPEAVNPSLSLSAYLHNGPF